MKSIVIRTIVLAVALVTSISDTLTLGIIPLEVYVMSPQQLVFHSQNQGSMSASTHVDDGLQAKPTSAKNLAPSHSRVDIQRRLTMRV